MSRLLTSVGFAALLAACGAGAAGGLEGTLADANATLLGGNPHRSLPTEREVMDDETAASARWQPDGPEHLSLERPMTGHFILSDDTARYRRTFGIAPSLMTPWERSVVTTHIGRRPLHVTARYDDLEYFPGQHRSVVVGIPIGD